MRKRRKRTRKDGGLRGPISASYRNRGRKSLKDRTAAQKKAAGTMQSSRRAFLAGSAGAVLSGALAAPASAEQIVRGVFTNGDRPLSAFPQKRPLMVLTPRPPQLETPFAVFDQGVFTPNDAFFVRWHLADIPTSIDAAKHRIRVGGAVAKPLSLSMADLRRLPAVEIAAVNQ